MEPKQLAKRIRDFLETYAAKVPNYVKQPSSEFNSDNDDLFTSPDAYQLLMTAECLERGQLQMTRCWSEWGSGGYKPYTSETGKKNMIFYFKKLNNFHNIQNTKIGYLKVLKTKKEDYEFQL